MANAIQYLNSKVNHLGVRPPKGSDLFVVALCGTKSSDVILPKNTVNCKKCLKLMKETGENK